MGRKRCWKPDKTVTDQETPAVVLGAGINGLGVARSLSRARVPVWMLDTDECQPEMYTRAAKPVHIRALDGDILIEDLERLGGGLFAGKQPVLFFTQEATVKTVSQHLDHLTAFYRFSLPPPDTVAALQHKYHFQQLAERHGDPISPLVHVTKPADLATLRSLHYPAVLKVGERNVDYSRRFHKAYRVETAGEASRLASKIIPVVPDVVAQEWIEGPDSNIYFCLQYLNRNGRAASSFTGRKLRSWPPQVGGTASCTAAPEVHAELSRLTERFFRDVGVVGMAGMEYKRDTRSGEFRMVEPTIGRTDFQEEVATLNGTNIPYAAYRSELGMAAPEPREVRRPVVWRVRSEDSQSAAAQNQQIASAWPRRSRVVDGLWRWSDPIPLVVHVSRRLQRALSRRLLKPILSARAAGSKP